MELQAHRFAAAFLFPARSFVDEVYSLALDSLLEVKKRWRVSIQVMIRRARDLDLVSQDKYERAFRELSRRGYRTREPLDADFPVEHPTLLSKAIRLLVDQAVMTRQELVYRLPFSAGDIEILANLPRGYLDAAQWGEVVDLPAEYPRLPAGNKNGNGARVLNFKRPRE